MRTFTDKQENVLRNTEKKPVPFKLRDITLCTYVFKTTYLFQIWTWEKCFSSCFIKTKANLCIWFDKYSVWGRLVATKQDSCSTFRKWILPLACSFLKWVLSPDIETSHRRLHLSGGLRWLFFLFCFFFFFSVRVITVCNWYTVCWNWTSDDIIHTHR